MQVEDLADLLASRSGRAVIVDASFVFAEGFSLARIFKLADLRAKDICCFTNLESARLTSEARASLQPVNLGSHRTCPVLHAATEQTSHFHALPLSILTAATASQLADGNSMGSEFTFKRLLSAQPGNHLHGLQVPAPWSAELWHSHLSQLCLSSDSTASAPMPERFRQAEEWDYSVVKKVHPVYATSSQQIGCKKPCQHDMQTTWAGIKGGLAEFGPTKRTTSGLKTAVRTSKVHQSMDGWC